MKQIKWEWHGIWIVDWLTCDRNDLTDNVWKSFDIWKEAYLKAHPHLESLSDLELIENHYCQAMKPIFDSWIFKFWLILHWPMSKIHSAIWNLKRKFS